MSDEIRQYIRAAQEAEVRGERPQAAELLCKAARAYRSSGRYGRALSLLRHALRLDPSRGDVAEEIRRLEWLPDVSLQGALGEEDGTKAASGHRRGEADADADAGPEDLASSDDLELRRALEPLEGNDRGLIERGPTLADASKDAWCSFCCRPAREVGQLVAGPAGAFVCASCTAEARRLLGSGEGPSVQAPSQAAAGEAQVAPSSWKRAGRLASDRDDAGLADTPEAVPGASGGQLATLTSQTRAIGELIRAIEQGRRRVLLLGPSGSGKSAMLRAIAQKSAGVLVDAGSSSQWPRAGLLLLDGADGLDERGWVDLSRALDATKANVILALRGRTPEPTYFLITDDEEREPLPSSQSLVTATGGKLPLGVAEAVDFAASLEAPDHLALCELAQFLFTERMPEDLTEGLAQSLAEIAFGSGRGMHELVALVRRVPPGAWRLDAPGGYRGRRKSKPRAGGK